MKDYELISKLSSISSMTVAEAIQAIQGFEIAILATKPVRAYEFPKYHSDEGKDARFNQEPNKSTFTRKINRSTKRW